MRLADTDSYAPAPFFFMFELSVSGHTERSCSRCAKAMGKLVSRLGVCDAEVELGLVQREPGSE
jgi:hypothetical protein